MKRLILLLLFLPSIACADPARDETRAQNLFSEVRCVQCQSESIADSDAAIAADMRREVRADIAKGMSDAQIRQSLYDHYGDYVLFRPRLTKSNLILWALPPLIAVAGVVFLLLRRKMQEPSESYALTVDEQKKLRELLKKHD
jgi:cytochrome c-type biogenesis protein CcmH